MNEPLAANATPEQARAAESNRQAELHALIGLTAALGASTDLDISLRVLVERMVSSFGAAGAECRLLATAQELTLLAQHGLDPSDEAAALRRAALRELSAQAFQRGEAVYLSDFASSAHRAGRELMRSAGYQALLCVPLLGEAEPLGTLALYFNQPRQFTSDERALLSAIGTQLAANIARARMYELERTRAARLKRQHTLLISLSRASANLQTERGSGELMQSLQKELLRQRLHSALLLPEPETGVWRVHSISLLASTVVLIEQRYGVDLRSARLPASQIPRLLPMLARGTPLLVKNFALAAQHWLPNLPSNNLEHLLVLLGFTHGVELIVLPLKMDKRLDSLLCIWGVQVSRDNLVAFSAFAHQVAAALRSARLREQVDSVHAQMRRLTKQVMDIQEEERARISRELHDEAGQALTALKIELTLLANELSTAQPRLHERMRETLSLVGELLDSMRRLAHEMHPPALETLGLNATLEGYCESFSQRTRIVVKFAGSPRLDCSPHTAIALYRLLQEALTNVARHAQATQVDVALRCDEHSLTLSVGDDGCGFAVQRQSNGLGLAGMRERVEAMGGKLEIESQIDVGTRLTARVPLSASD